MFAEHGESSRVAVRRQWVACLDDFREGATTSASATRSW